MESPRTLSAPNDAWPVSQSFRPPRGSAVRYAFRGTRPGWPRSSCEEEAPLLEDVLDVEIFLSAAVGALEVGHLDELLRLDDPGILIEPACRFAMPVSR